MDTTILVERHIKHGEQMLDYLFQYNWKISIAFWNKSEFSDEWKLYLALPILKREGARSIYLRLTKRIMLMQPRVSIDVDDIVLIRPNNIAAREVRNKIRLVDFQTVTRTFFLKGDERINGKAICYSTDLIKSKKV